MAKIYIVEDDVIIRQELELYLRNAGYETTALEDFTDPVTHILESAPDLVLMDVNLPGTNGLLLCEQIRRQSQLPIIFVTGNDTSMDELNCILRGGDDYVAKPYQLPILLARIAAVLKRTCRQKPMNADRMVHKGVTLDMAVGRILKDGQQEELTKNELKILSYLFEHAGKIVSREELIDFLWDHEVFIDDNSLSVNITRVRGKLEQIGAKNYIETRRGLGYLI